LYVFSYYFLYYYVYRYYIHNMHIDRLDNSTFVYAWCFATK